MHGLNMCDMIYLTVFRDDVGIPVFFILKAIAFQWFTGLDKETLIGDEGNLRIFENFISTVDDEEL